MLRGSFPRAVSACLVLLGASACRPSGERPAKRKLSLYCSAQVEWCQLLASEFQAETGISVSMTRKSSGEAYAQLWAERRNPKGDVWWGGTGDAHLQAAESGLSAPHTSPALPQLHPWARDPEGSGRHLTTGVYMGALGLGYNSEVLARRGLPVPRRWADLVDPRFKGEIQMANPASSGTAYTALATFVQLFGEEEGFAYLRALNANVNQYTKSGAAPVSAAARGETAIGISFLHDAAAQREAGFPLVLVAPEEGTGLEIGCVSLIEGARHPESARRFIDWSLSPRAQELGSRAKSHQWPANREARPPPSAPRFEDIRLIPFDFQRFGRKAERARLLARWESEVRAEAR